MSLRKSSPEKRVRDAKRIVKQAQEAATQVATDQSRTRSTRTRGAYKVKADALDRVGEILHAK